MIKYLLALAALCIASPAVAQVSANLPATCSPGTGTCIRATPVTNPDGTNIGTGTVSVSNFPATQPVSGPVTNAQITAVTGTATTPAWDGVAASTTQLAIMRAMYTQFAMMITLLGEIQTNTQPVVP